MTSIGILSDSHGRDESTERAARLLAGEGADLLIHLGDIGTASVLDALVLRRDGDGHPSPPVHIVFGNIDEGLASLRQHASALGIFVDHPVGRLTLGGKRIVFQHGDLASEMAQALEEKADYLCHGHTHVARDERIGPTRVINPGALHRAREYTVALLDLLEDYLRFIPVRRQ